MKVMLNHDGLWRLWLGFFRHFAAIMSVVVLLPLALHHLATGDPVVHMLRGVHGADHAGVRRPYGMQSEVEQHYQRPSPARSDGSAMSRLVQSFVRIDAEVQGVRGVADQLLAAQMPVLSWWALVTVITRASTTITVLRDLHRRHRAARCGPQPRSARS